MDMITAINADTNVNTMAATRIMDTTLTVVLFLLSFAIFLSPLF